MQRLSIVAVDTHLTKDDVSLVSVPEDALQFRTHLPQLLPKVPDLTVTEGEGHHQTLTKGVVSPQPEDLPVDGALFRRVANVTAHGEQDQGGIVGGHIAPPGDLVPQFLVADHVAVRKVGCVHHLDR